MKTKSKTTVAAKTKALPKNSKPLKSFIPPALHKETKPRIWFQFGIPSEHPKCTHARYGSPLITAKPLVAKSPSDGESPGKDSVKSDTSGSSEELNSCEEQELCSKDHILEQVFIIYIKLGSCGRNNSS